MRFDTLNLDPRILNAIHEMGYEKCTPVQEQALPEGLNGHDIMAQAQTGTGKTAVFLVTILQRMITTGDQGGALRAVVLVPTRELAVQVEEQAVLLCKHLHYRSVSVYGGVGYDEQERALAAGAEIVVATPGRLIDFLKSGKIKLGGLAFFVIDEADRMFDMGFMDDVKYILRHAPPREERQTILVSATLDDRVRTVAYQYMREAVEVEIEPDQITVEKVEQFLFHVSTEEKIPLLLTLLKRENMERVVIFTNMKRTAEDVGYKLNNNGFTAEVLTGDIDQKKRLRIIERMKNQELHVLVATDVAARGLHIDNVTHVINYDIPADPANYVHRIGRTARAGANGQAYTLACEYHVENLPMIERYIEKKIEALPIDFELVEDAAGSRPRGRRGPGGAKGDRGGRFDRGPKRGRPGEHRAEGRRERPQTARDSGPKRPEHRDRPMEKPKKEMSQEERMEMYRRKYGESFGGKGPEGGVKISAPAGGAEKREGQGRRRGRGGKGKKGHGDKAPRTATADGEHRSHHKEHGRKESEHHKKGAHGHKAAPKGADAPKKKGIISKLFGMFKKK